MCVYVFIIFNSVIKLTITFKSNLMYLYYFFDICYLYERCKILYKIYKVNNYSIALLYII